MFQIVFKANNLPLTIDHLALRVLNKSIHKLICINMYVYMHVKAALLLLCLLFA